MLSLEVVLVNNAHVLDVLKEYLFQGIRISVREYAQVRKIRKMYGKKLHWHKKV